MRITVDVSKMTMGGRPIGKDQLAMMKNTPLFTGLNFTFYSSGKKLRMSTPYANIVMDAGAKTSTILMPTTKQYMTTPASADTLKQLTGSTQANIVDTKSTATILGHKAHRYKVFFKNAMMTLTGYVWVARDLPSMPSLGASDPMLKALAGKMAGFPLKMTMDLAMPSAFGQISLAGRVTAISDIPSTKGITSRRLPMRYRSLSPAFRRPTSRSMIEQATR
jgi:hypothetical protein